MTDATRILKQHLIKPAAITLNPQVPNLVKKEAPGFVSLLLDAAQNHPQALGDAAVSSAVDGLWAGGAYYGVRNGAPALARLSDSAGRVFDKTRDLVNEGLLGRNDMTPRVGPVIENAVASTKPATAIRKLLASIKSKAGTAAQNSPAAQNVAKAISAVKPYLGDAQVRAGWRSGSHRAFRALKDQPFKGLPKGLGRMASMPLLLAYLWDVQRHLAKNGIVPKSAE